MSADLFLRPLFDWRAALASPFGPKLPTTRHVLLTLSLHMSAQGDSCFPSIERLIAESALSRRAVIQHLKAAAEAGWLGKREIQDKRGQGWRRIEYFPLIPEGVETAVKAARKESYPQGGAPGAPRQGGARGAQGGARGAQKVVHQVHPSTSLEYFSSTNILGDEVARHTQFEAVFKSYPQRSGNNPKRDAARAWTARMKEGVTPEAMAAGVERYAAWCTATGKVGTEYVLRAATFFGPGRPFEQGWPIAEDLKAAPKIEARCIFIPAGGNMGTRCSADGAIAVGAIELDGRKIGIHLCHRHHETPLREPGKHGRLVVHPEVKAAIERFQRAAAEKLVAA